MAARTKSPITPKYRTTYRVGNGRVHDGGSGAGSAPVGVPARGAGRRVIRAGPAPRSRGVSDGPVDPRLAEGPARRRAGWAAGLRYSSGLCSSKAAGEAYVHSRPSTFPVTVRRNVLMIPSQSRSP